MKSSDNFSNFNSITLQSELTTITRTVVIEGFSVPAVIRNGGYYFTDMQVYSDGLIDCWDMVDLPLFEERLNRRWVVTEIPNGEIISIHGLGRWITEQGEWVHTRESLYSFVISLIKQLNPGLENLHNYYGSNTKLIGKVNVSKHPSSNPKPYYSDNPKSLFSAKISGEKFHVFYRNNDGKTYLTALSIYENGRVELTNLLEKKVLTLNELREYVKLNLIIAELKIEETVTVLNLGSFKIKSGKSIDIRDKMKELEDALHALNGVEDSLAKCSRIFEEYKAHPTMALQNQLKEAYEAIPKHLRMYVGTMDTKDYEVRQVIYGDIMKEEWMQHYGFPYPYDDMPKPTNEE